MLETQTATQTLASINPATGETVGHVPVTDPSRIAAMAEGTRPAQRLWAQKTLKERRKTLMGLAEGLLKNQDALGRLITEEMGKPLGEARGEIGGLAGGLKEELKEIHRALKPQRLKDARTKSKIYHDPLGVCAAITPWNFPAAMPHSMIIPALMAGNSVVFKPSEETPLVGQAYFELLRDILPPGLIEIVHGADEQGKALVAAPVDLIAFTGSREVGKKIMAAAAGSLKRLVLELGGKDPLIVMKSANLEKAADFAAHNSFRNAGQVCVSTERIYVDQAVSEAFERLIVERAARYVSGNGMDEDTKVGPMIHEGQRGHVLRQMQAAEAQGARLAAGTLTPPERYITPTVLVDLDHKMEILQEETFGPVACLVPYQNVDQAVEWANDTPFGLGAVVFGAEKEARAVARRLTAGMIGVNKSCGGAGGTPWVGAKESGYGFHSSVDGHRQFAQTRVVSVPRSK